LRAVPIWFVRTASGLAAMGQQRAVRASSD
jgi:hypothetical protein